MRKPLLSSKQQQRPQQPQQAFIPPPWKGINEIQPVINADPTYALYLKNFWPVRGALEYRGGRQLWASRGGAGEVKRLAVYNGVVPKLFACTNSGIYDATAGGAMGATVQALTSGYWDAVNFTNPAGSIYLWGANGSDTPKMWNGAVWATPAITNTAFGSASLKNPWLFKRRIFCLSSSSTEEMLVYYLPTDSIQGAVSKLPLGALFPRGGALIAGTNWTLDGGNGPDDYCVFVTTQGECAIYQGTDPSSASSWSLVGVFYLGGAVISPLCFIRDGADILIATKMGLVSLNRIAKGEAATPRTAESALVFKTWAGNISFSLEVVAFYFARRAAAIISFDAGGGSADQLLQNREIGAWTTFEDWNPKCFAEYVPAGSVATELFFGLAGGTAGDVHIGWYGTSDIPSTFTSNGISYIYYGATASFTGKGFVQPQLVRLQYNTSSFNLLTLTTYGLYSRSENTKSVLNAGNSPGVANQMGWVSVPLPILPGRNWGLGLIQTGVLVNDPNSAATVLNGVDLLYTMGQSALP